MDDRCGGVLTVGCFEEICGGTSPLFENVPPFRRIWPADRTFPGGSAVQGGVP